MRGDRKTKRSGTEGIKRGTGGYWNRGDEKAETSTIREEGDQKEGIKGIGEGWGERG